MGDFIRKLPFASEVYSHSGQGSVTKVINNITHKPRNMQFWTASLQTRRCAEGGGSHLYPGDEHRPDPKENRAGLLEDELIRIRVARGRNIDDRCV